MLSPLPITALRRRAAVRPTAPATIERGEQAPLAPVRRLPAHRAGGQRKRHQPRTAFVLAGGASLGALQVGMLRALYERDIQPDFLVGTSAGALNAAYVASRPQTVETAKQLGAVWRGLRRRDVFSLDPATLFGGLASQRNHLVPNRPMRQLVARHLGADRLEEMDVPLHLVAFDLLTGSEVRLSEGPALEAVLAAAAIPGLLPPVAWGDLLLVDGGVGNNTPISHAVELGAERIYVLPTQDPGARGVPGAPRGAVAATAHAITLLIGARLQADLARYADAAQLIVLPAANPRNVQPTDFGHADSLIITALRAARKTLEPAPPSKNLAA
jgi:NTE family protein